MCVQQIHFLETQPTNSTTSYLCLKNKIQRMFFNFISFACVIKIKKKYLNMRLSYYNIVMLILTISMLTFINNKTK